MALQQLAALADGGDERLPRPAVADAVDHGPDDAVLVAQRVADDRSVDDVWASLENGPADGRVFTEAMVADLPEPARRYFLHAIRPGTPVASRVRLAQAGSIRVGGDWAPFTADQVLSAGQGFVWKVRARISGLPVAGTDLVAPGEGRMRLTAFGLVPLLFASGPGSEIQRPLAIVVIGGLVTSTLLTLVLLPILFARFGEGREAAARA